MNPSFIPYCDLEPAYWLLFGANVPPLVYYTQIPNIFIALLFAALVLIYNWRGLPNRILFVTLLSFCTWVFFNQIFWATNRGDIIMFAWLMDILVEPLVHIGIFYLLYTLITQKDLPLQVKLLFGALYLPIPLLLPTPLTLSAFDIPSCLAIEGPIALYYTYFVEIVATISLVGFIALQYFRTKEPERRKEILYLGSGGILLLLAFSWGNITGSFTENWELGQYGLYGMPLFIGFLVYSIVRFKTFNTKVFGTQALVFAVACMLFALLFIHDIRTARWIVGANLFLFAILGYQIVLSVKREIEQRTKIEDLAKQLAKANVRLRQLDKLKSEFVSIASHQLRSPLTAMRGYASMLLEGSFGAIPEKAKEPLSRIEESSRFMALSVDDFLNVSRIESGSMKYEMAVFSLKELASTICDEMRPAAMKKGLVLLFRSDATTDMHVKADAGKLRQILQNLVDNAMKYTPKGSIDIVAHDDAKAKKAFVSIIDTGVGMSKETLASIFEKFVRAKNANVVNVYGTGLGLYIAKQMAEAMGGTISSLSNGEGKGSTFRVELPLQK